MGTITKGRYLGTDSVFKYRKPKSAGSSLRLSSQRKDSLEKKAIDDRQGEEQAKAKEISRREKERKVMRSELEKRVSKEETDPNRNTAERRKVVNVGRPDTAKNPMDTRSKLAKQGEIQRKIIEDQEKSMTLQKFHNLPDDLVSAVRSVLEGKKNPFAKDDDKDDKKSAKKDDDDKNTKSKKSDDDDSDDDQDKQVGKDGKKTKVDINPTVKAVKEEVEDIYSIELVDDIDDLSEARTTSRYIGTVKNDENAEKAIAAMRAKHGPLRVRGRLGKNSPHAALYKGNKHADSPTYRKSRDVATKHSERMDVYRRYDEEVALSDEETSRILAKLNEADDEDEKHDGPEHIVMQLRKAKSLGAANRPIHFHDGSKVKVDAGHVQKALDMHGSFKKAPEKDEFTQKLQASHASFKKAIGAE